MAAGDVAVNITTNNSRACAKFDGVDDFVDITHNKNQLGANLTDGFTISAWILPRSTGELDGGRILDKSTNSSAANGFRLNLFTTGRLVFGMNAGTNAVSNNNAYTIGKWVHVLVTVTSAQIASIYADGILVDTPTDLVQPISTITTTNNIRIGNIAAATTHTFDGAISGVQMWNKVLTATEIARVVADRPVSDGLIIDVPLNNDYTDVTGAITNSGSYETILDDSISRVISGQRVVASASGAYIQTGMKGGQIVSVAITETP